LRRAKTSWYNAGAYDHLADICALAFPKGGGVDNAFDIRREVLPTIALGRRPARDIWLSEGVEQGALRFRRDGSGCTRFHAAGMEAARLFRVAVD
jgi:hypothetical protein